MTPAGIAQLKLDEGLRLAAYPDPLSPLARQMQLALAEREAGWDQLSGVPWTIGYGHTASDVDNGLTWDDDQADAALLADIATAEQGMEAHLPWVADLSPVRLDVLINIAFNVGVTGLLKWPTTLGHVQAGNYAQASQDLLTEGPWDAQVGARAKRLAAAMLSDSWPASD